MGLSRHVGGSLFCLCVQHVESSCLTSLIRPRDELRRKRPDSTHFGLFPVSDGANYRVYIVGVKALTNQERETLRATIDDDIINMSIDIDAHDLPQIAISKGREQDYLNAYAALCAKGCNPITLLWSLRLGRAALGKMPPPPPPAKVVKGMVKRLDEMESEIRELEKSGFLMLVNREETERLWKERKLGMKEIEDLGETLPHLDLPRWLKKKAEMYRRWLTIASLRVAPKDRRTLVRLEYLYPALYVREATGEPCSSLLMRLFETIGIPVSKEQLNREFASLKRDYKWLLMEMKQKLYIVAQRTSGMYEEELSAFAAELREQQGGSSQTKNLTQGAHSRGT